MDLSPDDPRLARWHYYMALAHFAAERYDQAGGWAERVFENDPGKYTTADAHLILASSHAKLGRPDMARESLNDALRLWPTLTPDLVPLPPYTDADLRKSYLDGLRKAGLEG